MAEPRYIPVIAPDGSKMELPEANLSAALADGFAPDTNAQYEGHGGRAFLEGVGRDTSFGLSDVVQAEGAGIGTELGNYLADLSGYGPTEQAADVSLGAESVPTDRSAQADQAFDESRAGLLGRQHANAGAATAGELLGGLGLGLATGGLGTAGLLGRGTTALGRAGYTALAGGLEGAAYGAAKAADDDFLNDREITAERIILGAGEGALLGGALGGSMSLLGTGAQRTASKAADLLGALGRKIGVSKADETVDSLMAKAAVNADAQSGVDAQTAMRGELGAAADVGMQTDDALRAELDNATDLSMSSDDALRAGIDSETTIATQSDEVVRTQVSNEAEAGLSFELTPSVDPVAQQEAKGALLVRNLPDDGRPIWQQARDSQGGWEAAQQAAVRDTASDLKTFVKAVDQLDTYGGIAAKRQASKTFNTPGMKVGMQEVKPMLDDIRAGLADLMSSDIRKEALKDGGGYTSVSRVLSMIDSVEKEVGQAFASGRVGDGYMMLDQGLKRTMQKAGQTRNPIAKEFFRRESDKVRLFLEADDVFGELAARQRRANPAWTERIRREGDADIGGFFKRSGEGAADPFEVLDRPSESAIGNMFRALGDAEYEGTEEAFRRYLRASVIDAEERAAAWGGKELQSQAKVIRESAERIEARMNDMALRRRSAEGWKEVADTLQNVPFAGAALKGVVNLTNRLAGVAELQASRSANTTSRTVSNAEMQSSRSAGASSRSTSNADLQASRTAGAYARGSGAVAGESQAVSNARAHGAGLADINAARRLAVFEGAKGAARRGEQSLASSAANLVRSASAGIHRKAAKAAASVPIAGVILKAGDAASYESAIQHLLKLQDAASNERQRLQERNAELAAESPEHASALDAQVQRTADFLVSKAGQSGADVSRPFANLRKPKHDRGKAQTLARYARAAQNPQAALARVSDGTYTREDLETLQELYPRLWARFGGKVRAELAALETPPSYQSRLVLSRVLGQPMTTFETPTFQAIMSGSRGKAEQAEAEAQAAMAGPGQQTVSPSNVSVTQLAKGTNYAGSDRAIARGE